MNDNDDILCYHTFRATEFLEEKPVWKYYEMTPDPSVGKIAEGKSGGIISFRCFMRKTELKEFQEPLQDINLCMQVKTLPKRPKAQKVRAYIFQCKDLPPADDDGLADPYVQMWDLSGKATKSEIVNNSLDPIFYMVKDVHMDIFLKKSLEDSP